MFNDDRNLYLLLNLRLQGYSFGALATVFHCDKMAVKRHCEKYGIYPMDFDNSLRKRNSFSLPEILDLFLKPPISDPRWVTIDGEKINRGRSYREYLKSTL